MGRSKTSIMGKRPRVYAKQDMPRSEIPFRVPSKHWSAGVSAPPASTLILICPLVLFSISRAQASPALVWPWLDGKKTL